MTHKEIYDMLYSTGLSVTYLQWPEGAVPALPYICYYFSRSDNFGADDTVYQEIEVLNVELYTKQKDFTTEKKVEDALGNASTFWNKSETYLTSENMYEVLYESEVVITDEQQN